MITEEIKNIKRELEKLKKMGYIKSTHNTTAIATLKGCLNYDAKNIDLKVKHDSKNHYLSLFIATPEGKEPNQLKRLKDKYGYAVSFENKKKMFSATIQSDSFKFVDGKLFRLVLSPNNLKLYLAVYNQDYFLIDCKTYWSFSSLEKKYNKKKPYLILVKAWTKTINNIIYYRYYDYAIYKLVTFNDFLRLLNNGIIRVNIQINIAKKGDIKDFGTKFEIEEADYLKLYKEVTHEIN